MRAAIQPTHRTISWTIKTPRVGDERHLGARYPSMDAVNTLVTAGERNRQHEFGKRA